VNNRGEAQDKCIHENDSVVLIIEDCPACGSNRTEHYLDTYLTTFFFPVPEEIIEKVTKEYFELKICIECTHLFQGLVKPKLLHLIYNDFYAHYNLDTSIEFQEVYRQRTIEFIEETLSKQKDQKVLDVGCGEGTYFPFFEKIGYECYGIEPSRKGRIAEEKNPNAHVSNEFFEGSETNIFDTQFDVILLNWLLEHIIDFDCFFNKLKNYVRYGTRVIIQVPDIQYYIDNDLALFYVHEHIHYFTIETLRVLLERKGFKIVAEKHGGCPSVLICGEYTGVESEEKAYHSGLLKEKRDFLKRIEKLKKRLINLFKQYEKIVFYGMGLVAFWISDCCLDDADLGDIELIDDNTYYHGKVVPSFYKKLRIFPKGYNMEDRLIFISTSPVYHDKIKKLIKNRFTGNFEIGSIKDNDVFVE
jgi:SAM-dependent methyltransferase